MHNTQPADTIQVGGDHYRAAGIQPWHAMEAWMSPEAFAGFLRGNVIKYVARCDKKGGLQDLEKAQHYLAKLIELLKAHDAAIADRENAQMREAIGA
jgi:hypothetical protein